MSENHFPRGALHEAWEIQKKVAAVGFDWPDISGVLAKVQEELREIQEALACGDGDHAKRELGDLLFAAVNLARFLDAHPGEELRRSNARFVERFALLEQAVRSTGRAVEQCTLAELDEIWERVKRQ